MSIFSVRWLILLSPGHEILVRDWTSGIVMSQDGSLVFAVRRMSGSPVGLDGLGRGCVAFPCEGVIKSSNGWGLTSGNCYSSVVTVSGFITSFGQWVGVNLVNSWKILDTTWWIYLSGSWLKGGDPECPQ